MTAKWTNIVKSDLMRNFVKLFSANVIAQVIGLLVYPFLTRLYTPSDFGLYNLFLSIAGILVVISTCEYQNAVPLPSDDKLAVGAMHVGMLCLVAVTALQCCLLPFADPIARLFGSPELGRYFWLMPVFVFLSGLWQLLNYWFTRQKRFGAVSAYQISQSLTGAGAKWLFGFLRVPAGLLYSSLIAPLVALFSSLLTGGRDVLLKCLKIDATHMRAALSQFSMFPKYSLPKSLVNIVNCNIAVLIITPFFGLATSGAWGLAMTLGFSPLGLILNSLYQVLFPRCAALVQEKKPFLKQYRRYLLIVTLVVAPSFVLLYLLMPWLVGWFLGAGWDDTALMIRYLLPSFAMMCLVMPWSFLPDVFLQQKYALALEIAHLILRVAAIGVGVAAQSIQVLLIGYSLCGVLVSLIQMIWFWNMLRRYEVGLAD